ncbi:MAG TPA: hypothetical protein VFA56_04795 [Gaiellaceae bacterium]|nr:hypothetical protein [Gaiellaceae bacterium]
MSFFEELADWALAHHVPVETIEYGPHPDQVVDLRGDGRTLMVVHGGFWRPHYARDVMAAFAIAFAHAGWRTANVEYRRLGPGRWREQLEDVAAAAASVRPDVVVGHSAGGHLALWLGGVSLAGVCDLEEARRLRIGDDAVREFLGDADPSVAQPALDAANVLVHGTRDDRVPIELSRSYAERSGCELVELDGADHFDVIDPRYARFDEIIAAVERARPRPR